MLPEKQSVRPLFPWRVTKAVASLGGVVGAFQTRYGQHRTLDAWQSTPCAAPIFQRGPTMRWCGHGRSAAFNCAPTLSAGVLHIPTAAPIKKKNKRIKNKQQQNSEKTAPLRNGFTARATDDLGVISAASFFLEAQCSSTRKSRLAASLAALFPV